MVKHTQIICRLLLKGLIQNMKQFKGSDEILMEMSSESKEATTGGVIQKIVFLKIRQNSLENTYARASF